MGVDCSICDASSPEIFHGDLHGDQGEYHTLQPHTYDGYDGDGGGYGYGGYGDGGDDMFHPSIFMMINDVMFMMT